MWMSNDSPRCFIDIAEHSMCQPGRPGPDRRLPRRLAGLRALPEREVADVVLGVLVGLDALADPHLLRVEVGEPAVRRPRRDPEEDRAVVGPVGVVPSRGASRSGATMSSMCSVARGRTSGRVIRSAAASARKRSSQRSASSPMPMPGGRRAADDLVVDVGDVHHPRDPQAAVAQVADEDVGVQEAPEVADVDRAVDRRAAAVDPDVAGLERLERPRSRRSACPGAGSHPTGPRRGDRRGPRCRGRRPPSPSRLPVDALTLTAVRVDPEELGDRGRASRRAGSPGAAARRRS